jgi:hypothetical protein
MTGKSRFAGRFHGALLIAMEPLALAVLKIRAGSPCRFSRHSITGFKIGQNASTGSVLPGSPSTYKK